MDRTAAVVEGYFARSVIQFYNLPSAIVAPFVCNAGVFGTGTSRKGRGQSLPEGIALNRPAFFGPLAQMVQSVRLIPGGSQVRLLQGPHLFRVL